MANLQDAEAQLQGHTIDSLCAHALCALIIPLIVTVGWFLGVLAATQGCMVARSYKTLLPRFFVPSILVNVLKLLRL